MQEVRPYKKFLKIFASVLLYVFIAICIFTVVLTISGKRSGEDCITMLGRQMRIVISPSMEKSDQTDVSAYKIKDIPLRSMVFIDVIPDDEAEAQKWYADLRVGDVLTFKYVYVKQEVITHRIVRIEENGRGGYIIDLEGDNKTADSDVLAQTIDTSERNSPNYIIGKVTGTNYPIGLLVSMLKSKLGLILAIILPSLIILIFEIIKIVKMFEADKRERAQTKIESQQSELEELKRRLAELEQQRGEDPPNHDANGTTP